MNAIQKIIDAGLILGLALLVIVAAVATVAHPSKGSFLGSEEHVGGPVTRFTYTPDAFTCDVGVGPSWKVLQSMMMVSMDHRR